MSKIVEKKFGQGIWSFIGVICLYLCLYHELISCSFCYVLLNRGIATKEDQFHSLTIEFSIEIYRILRIYSPERPVEVTDLEG